LFTVSADSVQLRHRKIQSNPVTLDTTVQNLSLANAITNLLSLEIWVTDHNVFDSVTLIELQQKTWSPYAQMILIS